MAAEILQANGRIVRHTSIHVEARVYDLAKKHHIEMGKTLEKALVQELAALGVSVRPTPAPTATPEPARRPSASTHKERR